MASQPSGSFFSEQSMRKPTSILMAISVLALAVGWIYPSLDDLNEWITRPSDPEEIFESIFEDRIVARIDVLYREDFPIQVLIDHLQDERPLPFALYATRGPNRVWMLCEKVLHSRLGLGKDPAIREKWVLPVPQSLADRAKVGEWREASSKDELLIRHQMATWQLGEMEKSSAQFDVHLPFKRRQVAQTKQQLDAR